MNFLREIFKRPKVSKFDVFIDEFTLSPLNGGSNRYFLTHVKQCNRQMSTNMLWPILLNKMFSRLQSMSRKLKCSVTVISQTLHGIFQ